MGAIKGSGQRAIEAIVAARDGQGVGPERMCKGPVQRACLTSALAWMQRKLNKRTLEALIKAGAFDSIQLNRAALVASIDAAFEFANAQTGQCQPRGAV